MRTVTFSEELIQRNQLCNMNTRRDLLTNIHPFKDTMSWSAFDVSQLFVIKISKQRVDAIQRIEYSMCYKCEFFTFCVPLLTVA